MENLDSLLKQFEEYKAKGLSLNMARGKPCKEQLDLSMPMMDVLNSSADLNCEDGIDCRNYGVLGGIEECKRLLGEMIEVLKQFNPEDKVYICLPGNRHDMYDITSEGRIYEDEV